MGEVGWEGGKMRKVDIKGWEGGTGLGGREQREGGRKVYV